MLIHLERCLKSTTATLGLLLFFLIVLEIQSPRFFSWDDNATQFSGYYQYNYDAIVHQKTFPWMVWTQYAGQTNLSQSQSGVFYLPAYLATGLSWRIFDHPLWNIDLLIVSHLLLGAWGMIRYLSVWNLSPSIANTGGLLYATTPFFIIVSKSWIFVTYSMAYTPWLLLLVERLLTSPTKKDLSSYVLVKSLFFSQGYSHIWINFSAIEGLYFLWRWSALNPPRYWQSDFQSIFQIRPLTLHLHSIIENIKQSRFKPIGIFCFSQMLHLLIISPQLWINIQSVHESPFRKYRVPLDQLLAFKLDPADAFLSQLLYFQPGRYIESSSVIVFLGGSIILFYLIYKKIRKGEKWGSPHLTFFSFFILTILLSTSFYRFLALIPPFDILRWPFKFLMIVPFFYVATFSFMGCGKKDSESFRFSLILLFCSALQMIVLLNFQNQNPFSKLRVQNSESLKVQWPYREGRVLPVASDDKYVMDPQLLAYNFGTSNSIPTLAGYDQLIAVKNFEIALELQVPGALEVERVEQNLNHLQTWGVRYLTGSPLDPKIQTIDKLKELHLIYQNEKILVWEYSGTLPLLSEESNPKEAIRYITTPQAISFIPNNEPADYTLRFAPLDQLHYRCITDHHKGRWKPLQKNRDQTLKISIQQKAESIEVRYLPDSFQIYLFTISSILLCIFIFIRLKPI